MKIRVLGSESFGARSLACVVEANARTILIDPGVALARLRFGMPPHPMEIAAAAKIRVKILSALETATDVVISHYHGDHMPMKAEDPYQLSQEQLPPVSRARFWCKGPEKISSLSLKRWKELYLFLGHALPNSEGEMDGCLSFSLPMPHGSRNSGFGTVMMTRIQEEEEVFVHASDIQLLDRDAVLQILAWKPTTVLVSGPPLYLPHLTSEARKAAFENGELLARNVETVILDHHLLRSFSGCRWLLKLNKKTENKVLCAARFMGEKPEFLEARRKELYKKRPVPAGWHEAYAKGKAGFEGYLEEHL